MEGTGRGSFGLISGWTSSISSRRDHTLLIDLGCKLKSNSSDTRLDWRRAIRQSNRPGLRINCPLLLQAKNHCVLIRDGQMNRPGPDGKRLAIMDVKGLVIARRQRDGFCYVLHRIVDDHQQTAV